MALVVMLFQDTPDGQVDVSLRSDPSLTTEVGELTGAQALAVLAAEAVWPEDE